jgi:23S rRNA pseudouridine2605 synthase
MAARADGNAARMRVQRALARAGVASRRRADALVAAGRVRVNGTLATTGQAVDPTRDLITVDGVPVDAPPPVRWLVLHKPVGVLTTARDEAGSKARRQTVFDLVPPDQRGRGLTYVGRLDYMTAGVLLLTTDGAAAHRLTHPSRAVERAYVATVRGNAAAAPREIREGVELSDGLVTATHAAAKSLGHGRWDLEITIAEGRTREIRRLCEALGLEIERLVRTQFGPVHLGSLPVGRTRALTASERRAVEELVA